MKPVLMLICLLTALVVLHGHARATEEYAMKTGQSCASCHVDPSGGGELSAEGKQWQAANLTVESGQGADSGKRVFRLVMGFIHILTGFFWFGTILYVHLVLRPGYAAMGIPSGEKLVGLVSMVVMAVTGAVLTLYRVSSPDMLFQTRFGMLLTVKVALFLMMVCAAVFVLLVIAPRLRGKSARQVAEGKEQLDAAELARFDGKEGRPAYFACNGRVYDASTSRLWGNGVHMGRHHAGEDLTDALKLAPHGEEKITPLLVASSFADTGQVPPLTLPQKTFYVTAYLNLAAVVGIIFILALWRWW